VDRLQTVKRRVRAETPAGQAVVTSGNGSGKPAQPETPQEREPVAPAAGSSGSAAERLLAAKRKRRED
jgi:hypothetical protein